MCRRSTSLIHVKCFDRIAKFSRKYHRMDTRPVVGHYTPLMSVSLANECIARRFDRTDEGFQNFKRLHTFHCKIIVISLHFREKTNRWNFGFRAENRGIQLACWMIFINRMTILDFLLKKYCIRWFPKFQRFFISIFENANCKSYFFKGVFEGSDSESCNQGLQRHSIPSQVYRRTTF